ncbi:MAG: M24 family metallopeptidase [Candidatus Zixiibacteriota bacterium]
MDIQKIQAYLAEHELDGWLMADFHARNTIAVAILGLSGIVTRRSFYFIPAAGEPTALVHAIEKAKFTAVQGRLITFSSYSLLEQELKELLSHSKRVAMEYSPMGRLPYIGLVDAGTIELVRDFGIEVVSSADLVASFQACLSVEQMAAHRIAARNCIEIKDKAFAYVTAALKDGRSITEFDVCRFIKEQFEAYDMTTESGPNCSVDANAGDPHYEPDEHRSAVIKKGQLVLLDLWAKMKVPHGVFGDITWMAFAGTTEQIPARYTQMFGVLVSARDKAVSFLRENIEKRPVHGYEVDDACRAVVRSAGFGEFFTHRTGHSITSSEHGTGPNIDNLETEDRRRLQKGHLFSIEPGIYQKDCGFRTEINVLIGHDGVEVTTLPLQMQITPLL